jgi:quercetin dioxygenase-like cupin family protein
MDSIAPNNPVADESALSEIFVPARSGRSVWLNGDLYTVKASGASSGGSASILVATVPPGGGPPLHNHINEDEAFYILDGELTITVESVRYKASTGDFVFIPRGKFHCFRNEGVDIAKQLLIFTPGGFDRFFTEAGEEAQPNLPIPSQNAKGEDVVRMIASQYGSYQKGSLP